MASCKPFRASWLARTPSTSDPQMLPSISAKRVDLKELRHSPPDYRFQRRADCKVPRMPTIAARLAAKGSNYGALKRVIDSQPCGVCVRFQPIDDGWHGRRECLSRSNSFLNFGPI